MKYVISRQDSEKIALDIRNTIKIVNDYVAVSSRGRKRGLVHLATNELVRSLVVAEHYFTEQSKGKPGVVIEGEVIPAEDFT